MDALIGIWYVEDNVLTIKVIAINIYENGYKYIPVTPYISHLINIEDIDPIGYTKKPMAIAAIPKDIKKQLDPKTMRYKPVRMVRSLYSIRPLNSKGNNISYGYFKYVRQMAKENLSGEQIANSPELVHRFFDAPPF